ncbi:hypothetical protein T03_6279 [Trichinella britovi]|uniref:Uncharacterized protein n=1 Tax=Trichinella britovi TaxID=45882 RepID=A0A0V1CYU2_TRIBR|nr:hypothetical protein T03_6279 [Trichinella britovi]
MDVYGLPSFSAVYLLIYQLIVLMSKPMKTLKDLELHLMSSTNCNVSKLGSLRPGVAKVVDIDPLGSMGLSKGSIKA